MFTGSIVHACAILNQTIIVPSEVVTWHNLHVTFESWFFYFSGAAGRQAEKVLLIMQSGFNFYSQIFALQHKVSYKQSFVIS